MPGEFETGCILKAKIGVNNCSVKSAKKYRQYPSVCPYTIAQTKV